MTDARERCCAVIESYERGELSAEMALMHMLIASEDEALVEQILRVRAARLGARAQALWTLFEAERGGCAKVTAMLRSEPVHAGAARSLDESIARCRLLFDGLVAQSPEASVALYSLGSPAILAAATDEIVAYLRQLGLIAPHLRVLDVGAGIGRISAALAPEASHVLGIDVSPAMVELARAKCAALPNVAFALASGRDFALLDDGSCELVLAVDSFPYVVSAGLSLADALFAEAARVLVLGGHFVLLNFSYRDAPERDRSDVEALAARHDMAVLRAGERPFRLWDGTAFVLRRA